MAATLKKGAGAYPVMQPLAGAHEPVNQQIYRSLRQAIVNGGFPPGSPLSEKEISALFGVSRQPVREAFIKLAEAGLVRILPQRGTYVMKISAKRVEDGRFIREAVEVAVARRAAQRADAAQLAVLAKILDGQRDAARSGDTVRFLDLDDAFHLAIANAAECPAAWQIVENIKANMDRVRYLSLAEVSPLHRLIEQHEAVFTALQAHDADAAHAAMQEHLRELIWSFKPILDRNPAWFEVDG